MLISVVMPFIAIISGKIAENIGNSETFIKVICGNRFCGYVSMVVSGLFGALSIGLFIYFSIQYFVSLFSSSSAACDMQNFIILIDALDAGDITKL